MERLSDLHTICYKSSSIADLTSDAINELLTNTSQSNSKNGINGILLHSFGNFFQVLEGPKEQVVALYERIKADVRHENIFEVFNKPSTTPIFSAYSSKFQIPRTNEGLEKIRLYIETNASTTTTEKIGRLLRPFIFFE